MHCEKRKKSIDDLFPDNLMINRDCREVTINVLLQVNGERHLICITNRMFHHRGDKMYLMIERDAA